MTNKGKDLNLIKKSSTSAASKDLENRLQGMSLNDDGSFNLPDNFLSGSSKKEQSNKSDADKKRNNFTINI
jgi:hypothetical protein